MKRFTSEIIIDAPPQEVWMVLRSFESYEAWNPFLRRINGVRSREIINIFYKYAHAERRFFP